jgi:spermidine synthase
MTKTILFSTGFVAMAMEVIWSRAFAPVLKTQVYSFAMIVFAYLGATFLGSWMYRLDLRKNRRLSTAQLIFALVLTAFLPVLANNPRFVVSSYWTFNLDLKSVIILLGSICPFCALLGYLTPGLVDEFAAGQPRRAGKAYAINVLGCILGPLFACYILLPWFSERYALILLTLPFIVFAFTLRKSLPPLSRLGLGLALGLALVWSSFFSEDFEGMLFKTTNHTSVRRDYTASVISFDEGDGKWLLVNGIGMTKLTPITKFIADLPLAFHKDPPKSTLVICFGMGTTFRSALSWNIDTTAVELVPSVTKAFGFYHADAARCVNDPNAHIIIDDGRRYLKRTMKKFDVIVVDPPPPVEAAGSSLLFSKEFYTLAKQHLNPGGILQMWYPGDDDRATTLAVFRSIYESFPCVRCFPSVEGWGVHLVACMEPLEPLTAQQLAARMPETAQQDLMEWTDSKDVPAYLARVLNHEFSIFAVLDPDPKIKVTDDQPFNEYFLLRRLGETPSAN